MGITAAVSLAAAGGAMGGVAAGAAGKANQRLAEFNAGIADMQADDAITRGNSAITRSRGKTKQLIGSQRARLAAQGVDINSGSAAEVQADASAIGEMDAMTIANNAAREAWGYKVKAADYTVRGQIARAEGTSKEIGTFLGAGSKIFGYMNEE